MPNSATTPKSPIDSTQAKASARSQRAPESVKLDHPQPGKAFNTQRLAQHAVAGGNVAHRVFQYFQRIGDRHQGISEDDDAVGGLRQAD